MSATNDTPFILCVDLDGVVADYQGEFRRRVAAARGVDPSTIEEQTSWDFESCPSWGIRDRDHFIELHNAAVADGMFATMPEIPGASDALWALSDAGVHIRIVTHRLVTHWSHHQVVSDTVAWLQAPRPDGRPRVPYRDLALLSLKGDLAGDVLVDDGPRNIEVVRAARAQGKPAPLGLVFDTAYNRHIPGPRAHNWDEVTERIEALRAWRAADPFADA